MFTQCYSATHGQPVVQTSNRPGVKLRFGGAAVAVAMLASSAFLPATVSAQQSASNHAGHRVAVVDIGYIAADYFRKHPGRFISAHLADYSTKLEKQVPIGEGIVDWDDFFEASPTGGVKNYFVEMDPETFEDSAKFLLKV